jgi:hypothetical protein
VPICLGTEMSHTGADLSRCRSVWHSVNALYLTVVNECVDGQRKTMDNRHKLPAIMCVLTYLNRGQNVLITVNYIQTTHSSNCVYNVHHEQHNIMGGLLC